MVGTHMSCQWSQVVRNCMADQMGPALDRQTGMSDAIMWGWTKHNRGAWAALQRDRQQPTRPNRGTQAATRRHGSQLTRSRWRMGLGLVVCRKRRPQAMSRATALPLKAGGNGGS